MIEDGTLIYLASTCVVGLIILWWGKRFLDKLEQERITSAKESDFLGGVRKRRPPFIRGLRKMREDIIHDLAIRFTVIRRAFLGVGFFIWILAISFPFLHKISTTFVSLIAGAVAVILGIAARPFVENLISGVVISLSRQLNIGDTIEIEGQYGTVEDISVTHTTMKLWDWRKHMTPNSQMLNTNFVNYSTEDISLWAYVEFWVSVDSDIKLVKQLALQAVTESSELESPEPPRFWVMNIEKESVKCWVAGWANSPGNAWRLRSEVRQNLMCKLKEHGISPHSYHLTRLQKNE